MKLYSRSEREDIIAEYTESLRGSYKIFITFRIEKLRWSLTYKT